MGRPEFAALEPQLRALRSSLLGYPQMLLVRTTNDVRLECLRPVQYAGSPGHRRARTAQQLRQDDKDGIDFVKAGREGFERYLALYHAPQDAGGCHGCRFFLMCKGQCPGGSINGDWRNRSSKCDLWMALFPRFEAELIAKGRTPLSISPHRRGLEAFAFVSGRRDRTLSPPGLPRLEAAGGVAQ